MKDRCSVAPPSDRGCREGAAITARRRPSWSPRARERAMTAVQRVEKPKVLYVAGAHRSGTTLLASILGGYEGIFAAGELHEIWQNLIEDQPCGCGLPLDLCPVWGPILEEVRERILFAPLGPADAVRWRDRSARTWHTGRILALAKARRSVMFSPSVSYATLMGVLYAVIARHTGARVVVDSTKTPSGAALLLTMDHLAPYAVHLVRDPRATAYSWSRRKVRRLSEYEEPLEEQGPLRSGIQWLGYNLLTEWVSRHWSGGGWSRLRYEDLAIRPRASANDLASWLGVETGRDPFEAPDLVRLTGGHLVAGNPDRFDTGAKRVRPDDRWLDGMSERDRWAVTALSLPLLRRYGYRPTVGRAGNSRGKEEA
jgi:hypothetical protein